MATIGQQVATQKVNGQVAGNVPTREELLARIAELEADKALRAASATSTIVVKVMSVLADGTPGKGGIAVYGLQRNPVTLYAEQWERMLHGCNPAPGSVPDLILKACKDPRATRKAAKAS